MDSNVTGTLGEALVLAHFSKEGYEVYIPFGGKSKHDLIITKGKSIKTVQVKTTTVRLKNKRYTVQLKSVRANKGSNIINNFDNTTSDLLAIVIIPESRVIVLESKDVVAKCAITVS